MKRSILFVFITLFLPHSAYTQTKDQKRPINLESKPLRSKKQRKSHNYRNILQTRLAEFKLIEEQISELANSDLAVQKYLQMYEATWHIRREQAAIQQLRMDFDFQNRIESTLELYEREKAYFHDQLPQDELTLIEEYIFTAIKLKELIYNDLPEIIQPELDQIHEAGKVFSFDFFDDDFSKVSSSFLKISDALHYLSLHIEEDRSQESVFWGCEIKTESINAAEIQTLEWLWSTLKIRAHHENLFRASHEEEPLAHYLYKTVITFCKSESPIQVHKKQKMLSKIDQLFNESRENYFNYLQNETYQKAKYTSVNREIEELKDLSQELRKPITLTTGLIDLQKQGEKSLIRNTCSHVDLRNRLGHVRTQQGGTCYAHVAADMISFRLGQTVSPISIIDNYVQNSPIETSIKVAAGYGPNDGGSIGRAIQFSRRAGVCVNRDSTPSDPDSLSTSDSLNIQKMPLEKQRFRTRTDYFFTKMSLPSHRIDQELNQDSMVGVGLDSIALTGRKDPWLQTHAVGIVGRRYNLMTKECDYLIRNSWGSHWQGIDSDRSEDGYYWLSRSDINQYVWNVTYFKHPE